MKVKFNVPAQIKNALGKRETFKPGTYDLDEKIIEHWFIKGLIAEGKVAILESAIKPVPVKLKQEAQPVQEVPKPVASDSVASVKCIGTVMNNIEVEEIKPAVKENVKVEESIAAPKAVKASPIKKRRKVR